MQNRSFQIEGDKAQQAAVLRAELATWGARREKAQKLDERGRANPLAQIYLTPEMDLAMGQMLRQLKEVEGDVVRGRQIGRRRAKEVAA